MEQWRIWLPHNKSEHDSMECVGWAYTPHADVCVDCVLYTHPTIVKYEYKICQQSIH